MSVLFCHDHRFVLHDGQVWSAGAFDAPLFARYAETFGPVKVAARTRGLLPGEDPARLSPVFADPAALVALPNLSTLRNLIVPDGRARHALRAAVADADIVVARLPSEVGLLALDEAHRAGKPAIVEVVGCAQDALSSHGGTGAKAYAPLADLRMRRAVARADYVQYVSRGYLQRRYPSAGMTVGVSDVQIERAGPEVLERRLAAMGEQRPLVFGMVAVLGIRQKGVDVAIRALARARETDPALALRILGPGDPAPWRAIAAEAGLADAVEFCGGLPPGDAVLRWLDAIDVYVQASFQEGLPRALIEAMRQATPALASDAGGTAELIGADCLHRPGDHARLAGQMLRVRPVAMRAEMARENFAASQLYGIADLDDRRRRFWQAVLADVSAKTNGAARGMDMDNGQSGRETHAHG